MKYFIDTEFLEGTQKKLFGQTKPTIDLISIGIVAEDGREYYAISKDFNLKEAWNRYDIKSISGKGGIGENTHEKVYWIRDNVLKPIFENLKCSFESTFNIDFNYKTLKRMITLRGKSNKQISEEIIKFIDERKVGDTIIYPSESNDNYIHTKDVKFYGYYSDYDWVVFCWLFGKMIDLPRGFPMYCIDLKQELDRKVEFMQLFYCGGLISEEKDRLCTFEEKIDRFKNHPNYPKQTNEHNALSDARWNYELYKFLNTL